MKIGLRILLGYFLIVGLAGFFLLTVFVEEVKPGVRDTLEDTLADTANLLAVMVTDDVKRGTLNSELLARVQAYAGRRISARIGGTGKDKLDYRITITDARGIVTFDSAGSAIGADYSRWNDVYLTLRGKYGARSTREIPDDEASTVMHVAAPILDGQRIIGVLTVAKPIRTVQPFIERSQATILRVGAVLLTISLGIGIAFALWLSLNLRKLTRYAADVEAGRKAELPNLGDDEIGLLGRTLDAMRHKLEGKEYAEELMHTLAHELKSPIAAIQGAAELMGEDMPDAERRRFLVNILEQNGRQQQLIERMLELVRVEKQQRLAAVTEVDLPALLRQALDDAALRLAARRVTVQADLHPATVQGDALLLRQAVGNLLDNALDFTPPGSTLGLTCAQHAQRAVIELRDQGPGIPDYAMQRVFDRFYSLPRPDGARSTGLGLPFVREVCTLHSGQVTLANAEQGGAAARVDLPAAGAPPGAATGTASGFTPATPAPHKPHPARTAPRDTAVPPPTGTPQETRMQKALFFKVCFIVAVMAGIGISLLIIGGTIGERERYHDEAVRSIAADSVEPQTVIGPVIVIPVSEDYDEKVEGRVERRTRTSYQLVYPTTLKISGAMDTDKRYRGLHQVLVFSGQYAFSGDFDLPSREEILASYGKTQASIGKPFAVLHIADVRGIRNTPVLKLDTLSAEFEQGTQLDALPRGLHANLDGLDLARRAHQAFSFNLSLDGIESQSFVPVGKNNQVAMRSQWPHPQFTGRFLPAPRDRQVTNNGFSATWNVSSLAADAQSQLRRIVNGPAAGKDAAAGVDSFAIVLKEPVNIYTLAERAVKYGIMFVALTFAAFFLFEILKELRIHPVQYALVGLALAMFFLLLISLSEHIAFGVSYVLASVACIALITFYLRFVMGSWGRAAGFCAALTALYAALYGLLISENNALVLGSLLLFGVLAAVMVATRKVDWYQLGK